MTVYGGPIEATALGNIAVQLLACGAVKDIAEARAIIARGEALRRFEPQDADRWEEAYRAFRAVIG